jgi:cytochrome o ubiquinol oxidase subunit IV
MSKLIQTQAEASKLPVRISSYVVGFVLSVLTTLVAYLAVVYHIWSTGFLIALIVILAVIQLLVQLLFFLHLSHEKGTRWKLVTFLFALMVVAIVVIGSLWIMHNLNYNMMHMSPQEQLQYMQQNEGI